MQWQTMDSSVASLCIHMDEYIDSLEESGISTRGVPDRPLDEDELSRYRRTLAKARWPVNRVVPELAYGISALAQHNANKIGEVTTHHAKELDKLVQRVKDIRSRGGARLYIRKLDLQNLVCLTYFDASFAQEEGMKSQCGMFSVLTDQEVVDRPVLGDLVEYEISTIRRVVRSTMAAESAALSKSLDRQLYLRLMVETLLYGQPELQDKD